MAEKGEQDQTKKDEQGQDRRKSGDGAGGEASSDGGGQRLSGPEAVQAAREQFQQLSGRAPESVSGLATTDEGWEVSIDVVELQRVPRTTDVLGTYEVRLDREGRIVGYERRQRYLRSNVSEE